MLTAEDIDAFAAENMESISQAHEFARREAKGLPNDRWATARQMHLVAQGIRAQATIIGWLTEVIEGAADANTSTE